MLQIPPMDDRRYVMAQYCTTSNLKARIALHQRFSTNPYGWLRWVFDQFRLPLQCRLVELGGGTGDLWVENQFRIPTGWAITLSDASMGMVSHGLCPLIASQHDHQARRSMIASGLDSYAAVGRVVSSCQVSNLCRIS
jgi:hypothetical protein